MSTADVFSISQILISEFEGHYDTIMREDRLRAYALCQSILYECLYSRVFQLDEEQLRLGKRSLRNSGHQNALSSEHGQINDHRISFAYRAAKALDEKVYRNVTFDNWRDDDLLCFTAISEGIVTYLLVNLLHHMTLRSSAAESNENLTSTVCAGELLSQIFRNENTVSTTSLYDRIIRIGCLGLKQQIHWHEPRPQSVNRLRRYRTNCGLTIFNASFIVMVAVVKTVTNDFTEQSVLLEPETNLSQCKM
ncbi:hypothetical protein FGIG_04614 [Fasciola gigantica]|uniref:Uncharacterized protein n=1 Tax=Fasciola gigantica TaxID=46835 RepID=A0A504YAB6_FASGI|nr:hypothetical protein FGIG_04614 [Fasciola gigantica]